jgi:hypothetical protein
MGRDLVDYAGEYEHPGDGRITITHANGKLHWAFRGMSEPLVHREHDTFELPEAPKSQVARRPATRSACHRIFCRS